MHQDTVGILLSRREWNKLNRIEGEHKPCMYQYAKKGEEHNLEVVFLPIDKISMIEGKSEALAIKNNTIIRKGNG